MRVSEYSLLTVDDINPALPYRPWTMGIMAYSLLQVMQDSYHQPQRSLKQDSTIWSIWRLRFFLKLLFRGFEDSGFGFGLSKAWGLGARRVLGFRVHSPPRPLSHAHRPGSTGKPFGDMQFCLIRHSQTLKL